MCSSDLEIREDDGQRLGETQFGERRRVEGEIEFGHTLFARLRRPSSIIAVMIVRTARSKMTALGHGESTTLDGDSGQSRVERYRIRSTGYPTNG